jgi:hypothetical protein
MANLTMSIPHQLSREEVRRRIQQGIGQVEQQHGNMIGPIEQTWTGDTLDFQVSPMGQNISGKAIVEDQAVRVEVVLPWMLAALSGQIKQLVEQQGHILLEHHEPDAEK